MSGFGSKASAWCEGPDLRFGGMALSESASTKSLTIKSRLEKVSNENDGADGKIERLVCVEGACEMDEFVLGGPAMLLLAQPYLFALWQLDWSGFKAPLRAKVKTVYSVAFHTLKPLQHRAVRKAVENEVRLSPKSGAWPRWAAGTEDLPSVNFSMLHQEIIMNFSLISHSLRGIFNELLN